MLQGNRIEHPDYILKNKLRVDYKFYLENQIMNPTVQFLEIVMDHPDKMFIDAINSQVYSKIGMKQNNLNDYFKTKKIVYENENVYSEGDDDTESSKGSLRICNDDI